MCVDIFRRFTLKILRQTLLPEINFLFFTQKDCDLKFLFLFLLLSLLLVVQHYILVVVICHYFFCQASDNKSPKTNRMFSSLHLQHFSQYYCISQQCSLFHHSNIVCYPQLLNPAIKFFRDSIGTDTTSPNFCLHNLPIALCLSFLALFHFLLFFFPTHTSAGTAIQIIIPFHSLVSVKVMSGLLPSVRLSH